VAGLGNYYGLQKETQVRVLPDGLNAVNACFEESNTEAYMRAPAVADDCVFMLSVADESKNFKTFTRPWGQTDYQECVLRACMDQLASVFTDIFQPLPD
jgi:hypothetical protein